MKNQLLLLLLLIGFLAGRPAAAQDPCPVIPLPVESSLSGGTFPLRSIPGICYADSGLAEIAQRLQYQLHQKAGLQVPVGPGEPDQGGIFIGRLPETEEKTAYTLEISPEQVSLKGADPEAIYQGIMSLVQLIRTSEDGKLPCWNIRDRPRYGWRGLMLDESRYFFGKEKVKQLLDWMAYYKLNRFHWHLTDAPGWRLEIQQYPRLALVGGIGNHFDPDAPVQYYTQADIAEIVRYAKERFIAIIPEIDMPGHAAAANRAYPEFSGGGSEKYPDFTFNPGKEGTYEYLTGILKEVDALFPFQTIHLGGDEVHFGNQEWETDESVQALMEQHQLKDLVEVEHEFMRRMADSVIGLNNRIAGWDEVAASGLAPEHTLLFWWRHDKPEILKKALEKDYQVVLCPRIPLYFDFKQNKTHRWGRVWNGDIAGLESVYAFPFADTPIPNGKEHLVEGIQANIWTEVIRDNRRLDFMTFPRIATLAEAAWTAEQNKDFSSFRRRLRFHLEQYDQAGIYYYNPFDPGANPEAIPLPPR